MLGKITSYLPKVNKRSVEEKVSGDEGSGVEGRGGGRIQASGFGTAESGFMIVVINTLKTLLQIAKKIPSTLRGAR